MIETIQTAVHYAADEGTRRLTVEHLRRQDHMRETVGAFRLDERQAERQVLEFLSDTLRGQGYARTPHSGFQKRVSEFLGVSQGEVSKRLKAHGLR